MLVFGCAVSEVTVYKQVALPGIRRAAEADSIILMRRGHDSIQAPYNEMMEEAAAMPDLEGLVLLHQDLELLDDSLPRRLRRVFEDDPQVGLLGTLGGRSSKVHRWFPPEEVFGSISPEGGGTSPASEPLEVDGVDGALLMLAPWVVRSLRFSTAFARCFHGYDADIGYRVRACGGKVICYEVPCIHRRMEKNDFDVQREAAVALAQMWEPTMRPREWQPAFER